MNPLFERQDPITLESDKMGIPTLYEIAAKLNQLSRGHPIGELQAIRKRRPGNPLFMINSKATHPNWAFHWGGRKELQFNIGLDENLSFSHGVAFSFRESREYKSDQLMKILRPKAKLFNHFMRKHPRSYADMRLWIWDDNADDWIPRKTPQEAVSSRGSGKNIC